MHCQPNLLTPGSMTTITNLVGTLELASRYRYGLTSRGVPMYLFRPYHEDQPDYIVGCSERDLSQNQLAIVDVSTNTTTVSSLAKPRANLVRLLGPVGDPAAERAAILQHYCPFHCPMRLLTLPDPIPTDNEFRIEISAASGWITLHVDPAGCRDIDDAIAWHPTERKWAIVIADVAAAVSPESINNAFARAIGATFYDLEGRVVRPMLPPVISEDEASLLPGQRRRGLALLFQDPTILAPGQMVDVGLTTTPTSTDLLPSWSLCWITVAHSYTYDSFASSEHAWMAGGLDPHDWIATQMIRYNAAAATLLQSHGLGLLRVQPPAEATITETAADCPPELRHLLNEQATYQLTDITKATEQGHAGLGLPAYTHASSPLRRYADLYNQRIIKFILLRTDPPTEAADLADHLNARSAANRRWTRDLTFLTHVTPGKVHIVDVVPFSATHVWVPLWKRLLRLRHEEPTAGPTRIAIFCDLTRRNWKMRVLTAPFITDSSSD